ncbi:hypothetical protein [Methylobacterium indicum]|uniref:hypothetical protein n=1 Tax=Methylobacterium indicum TaxID=1775910 RepID=UPI002435AD9A|nr:hypothetical protein [Methylobacterium indicum]
MNYELISESDYANLPEDNDRCFVEFEAICRRNMTRMIDENSSTDFDRAVREQYMTAVSAVAQECFIPNIPHGVSGQNGFWDDFSRFSLAVQGEIARIRIRQRGERNPHSVLLTTNTRTKIEHHISRIRELVEKSEMDEDRRTRLHEKLDILSNELRNQRSNITAMLGVLMYATTTVAAVTTIAADGKNAILQIMQLIGQDKESEDAANKRLTPPQKFLPTPVKKIAPPVKQQPRQITAHRYDDLDDDIPF